MFLKYILDGKVKKYHCPECSCPPTKVYTGCEKSAHFWESKLSKVDTKNFEVNLEILLLICIPSWTKDIKRHFQQRHKNKPSLLNLIASQPYVSSKPKPQGTLCPKGCGEKYNKIKRLAGTLDKTYINSQWRMAMMREKTQWPHTSKESISQWPDTSEQSIFDWPEK